MAYTTINKSSLFMNNKLYTGTGATQSITGVGHQPDMVWNKTRTRGGYNHNLTDSIRGATKVLRPNLGNAEDTISDSLTSFDTDGFTLGADASNGETNKSGDNYASWSWKAGTTTGINNTGSTIQPSTNGYSFNQTSGFSIIKYLGNLTSGAKVPHGLGVAPKMVITKKIGAVNNWVTYHAGVNEGTNPQNYSMSLNYDYAKDLASYYWNNTAPDAVNFTLGNSNQVNDNSNYHIAYCFAEIPGYSKIGEYFGNGNADGTFVYTGFKPAFVMVKRDDTTDNWLIKDIKRDPFNQMAKRIFPNLSNAEDTSGGGEFDFLSNGFKNRGTNTINNASGGSYIYMAFAEAPLVGTNGVTAKAR